MKKAFCGILFVFAAAFLYAETNRVSLSVFEKRVNEMKRDYKSGRGAKSKTDDVSGVFDDLIRLVKTDDSVRVRVITVTNYVFITNYVTEREPYDRGDDRRGIHEKRRRDGGQEGPVAMSEDDFKSLCRSVDGTPYKDEKMNVIKAAVGGNYFTLEQVIELMKKFQWDDERMNVLRPAYSRIVDKKNAYKLYDLVQWNKSKEEIKQLIEQDQ